MQKTKAFSLYKKGRRRLIVSSCNWDAINCTTQKFFATAPLLYITRQQQSERAVVSVWCVESHQTEMMMVQ